MTSLLEIEGIIITRLADVGGGDYDDSGHFVEGTKDTSAEVPVNIQPVTGQDLEQLPESDREKVQLKIYSKTEIRNSDRITRSLDGLGYKVIHVKNWTVFNIKHYFGMLVLENS